MTLHDDSREEFAELDELMTSSAPVAAVDPEIRRARRTRALISTGVVLAVVLASIGGYVAWALTAPLPAPEVSTSTPADRALGAAAIPLPVDGATAVSVSGADEYLGESASGIWLTSGTSEPRPIASITKIVAALVILDAHPLADGDNGPTLVFDKADHDLYDKYYVMGATIAPMPTGTSMPLRTALAAMIVPSACNYAEAVAKWAFGSQSGFARAARDWLAAHGLTGTTIVEPTGVSRENTSTPGDLIAIGKLAAADPVIARIAASPTVAQLGGMPTTNSLLGTAGITGLKTGNLGEGSYNFLYTATVDVGIDAPLHVTGVTLGGWSRSSVNEGVLGVLGGIRAGFQRLPVASDGDEVGTFTTPWGSSARMVVGESAAILVWSDTVATATMTTTTPKEYADGEVIGEITWTAGPNTVRVPVVIEGSIEPPTEWWRLTHPGELGER
ncbi:D-alanyl-D-alanine carboxypeptidase family protein [Microbacterium sp.]|uniref:D-alanyl-D-alanine carboxypeptidase family protein n=1 Tax=Microbacterium sp. TaxID=51671 RepID=UPI003F7201C7